jgi:hypothetical protein
VSTTWQVSNLDDLGWLQWGTGSVTGGVSVATLYPQVSYNMTLGTNDSNLLNYYRVWTFLYD